MPITQLGPAIEQAHTPAYRSNWAQQSSKDVPMPVAATWPSNQANMYVQCTSYIYVENQAHAYSRLLHELGVASQCAYPQQSHEHGQADTHTLSSLFRCILAPLSQGMHVRLSVGHTRGGPEWREVFHCPRVFATTATTTTTSTTTVGYHEKAP